MFKKKEEEKIEPAKEVPKKGEDNNKVEEKKVAPKEEQVAVRLEKVNVCWQIELKAGDYRVQIHILEAKDIKAKGKAGGGGIGAYFEGDSPDPMVEVEVMGQSKTTDYKKATASPIFNEQLFFEFNGKTIDDLETGMIKITLMDHDFIGSNNLLGSFTVDVSFIYKMNTDHELYRMWVAMTDPNDETQAINAFLKISINVLGPGDKPPVRDPSKGLKDKEDNGVTKLFTPGRVKMAGHIVKICIYRCEHLAPLDFEQIGVDPSLDPYVKVSFAGSKALTKYIKRNRNPEFNQELSLACKTPCMNSKIKLEIWDQDPFSSDRVGTYYFNFKESMNDGPRWANLYGPPLNAEGEYADLMTKFGDKGSHYRGRFLYSVYSGPEENPKSGAKDLIFQFPNNPSPTTKTKSYQLKLALYEAIELPDIEEACIHVT